MANPEHLRILRKGVRAWNKWKLNRVGLPQEIDLDGADLRDISLSEGSHDPGFLGGAFERTVVEIADLKWVSLRGAIFQGMDLRNFSFYSSPMDSANFAGANLRKATFDSSHLVDACFQGACLEATALLRCDLGGADFSGADMSLTIISGCAMRCAKFSPRYLQGATFSDVDLSGLEGTDAIYYGGPSDIGLNTFFRSRHKIPEKFLRGCGVAEELIGGFPPLLSQTFQFHSCLALRIVFEVYQAFSASRSCKTYTSRRTDSA